MSMPSFPPCGADMTKDEALTMIIASIAMEELALSHILNAEGEKLQYVLGTLPGGRGPCASTQEILAVNKSVKELMDTVMQSQMLLKGKLEKALEAGGCAPVPPGPCGPDRPPCAGPCCPKSAIQLVSRCSGFCWGNGTPMLWRCRGQEGTHIRWDEKAPSQVNLDPGKTYALNFTINTCGSFPGDNTGAICVSLTPGSAFLDILPFYFSVRCLECRPLTLQYSTTLFPRPCQTESAGLSLLLHYKDSLFVNDASLSIVEL